MFPTTSTAVPATFEDFMREHNLTSDHQNLEGWRKVWDKERFVESNAPTVIPPCPSWCIRPAGHDYDSTDGWGDELVFERQHVAFESAEIASVDATEHNHFGTVTLDEPGIYVSVKDDERTAEQARALAAELLEAVAVLDRITAHTRTCPRSAMHGPHDWASMTAGENWHCPGTRR